MGTKKLTVFDIINMKAAGDRIAALTGFDAGSAAFLDQAGIDIILVGDSLGMVVLGYESTVPVTMDEMIHHAKAAKRGCNRALLVGDMPFLSYQADKRDAILNAGRFIKEGGCDAVKLEGGKEVSEIVRAIVRAGIPVMGHIGLTPQTAGQLGGYKIQGNDAESARRILNEATALEDAGVFSLVLECIPDKLAEVVTDAISIPTIGIGAGPCCDGQILVTHDLLGMFEKFVPSFVKTYVKLAPQIKEAVTSFREEVKSGRFPDQDHSFTMKVDIKELLGKEDTVQEKKFSV